LVIVHLVGFAADPLAPPGTWLEAGVLMAYAFFTDFTSVGVAALLVVP
jgi:hypothetical protein